MLTFSVEGVIDMNFIYNYNIYKYINQIKEREKMVLEAIMTRYNPCVKYELQTEVLEYLSYVEKEPFYVSPVFESVKTDVAESTLNPKFVLFSAPGATGKSALAKYIAYKYNGIYWDVSKINLGTNSFAGTIIKAVGARNYSQFISDLNESKTILILDAMDEAEMISGKKMISSFISDISCNVDACTKPSVFILARTETAQFIASFCVENKISLEHYEISFFDESCAKEFIKKKLANDGETLTQPVLDCIEGYYNNIKSNISVEERKSFLGYAPVLEAIEQHIKKCNNPAKMLSTMSNAGAGISTVMNIMSDLLEREKNKVIDAFTAKCKSEHPEFSHWEDVYSEEEQLIRIVYFVLFNDDSYDAYVIDTLPPQLIDDYHEILSVFLPQHPFVRNNIDHFLTGGSEYDFTGPAFRDYTLSKLLLNGENEELANLYFEESNSQFFFPSQLFFDCYRVINDNVVRISHLPYVYDSYRAKATANERPYMLVSEVKDEETDGVVVFGMQCNKQAKQREDTVIDVTFDKDNVCFEQLANVSFDVPSLKLILGRTGNDVSIHNSSIICDEIIWNGKLATIESYPPEGCLIVSNKAMNGNVLIEIANSYNLRVSAPELNKYYKLIPYIYELEKSDNVDITRFMHAMHCILIEFRTHRKDTLGKDAERIENVTVANSQLKRAVLEFMKENNIIFKDGHLYKVNLEKMQSEGISYTALARMNCEQMKGAFENYTRWCLSRQG